MSVDPTTVAVIVNPQSAGGRTLTAWKRIENKLTLALPRFDVLETGYSGHGIVLASEAVRSGYGRVVAVGGDGTLNEVINGILSEDRHGNVAVGLIPQGTGSDFRRAVRLPLDEDEAIQVIDRGRTAMLDAMHVLYHEPDGTERTRYGLNVTSFGLGGAVADRVRRSSKPLGGTVAFLVATAFTAVAFKGNDVSFQEDDGEWRDVRITNIAVGNGQYHGAGMCVCPGARPDDGLLDVTVIEKLSVLEIVRNMRLLFNGRIYDHPKIQHSRTTQLVARSVQLSAIEIDGEPLGHLPLTITILPSAVRFIMP